MSNPDGSNNSANMSLPIPAPGVTPGDEYAIDINSSLTIIDGHDHTLGSGVQIPSAAIAVNATLPMNNNTLSTIKYASFTTQTVDAGINSLFFKGVDLYATDGNGNVIPITIAGAVNATIGTLSGGTGQTAAFTGSTLIVLSTASLSADIDVGSVILRNTTPNSSFGVTLSPISALGSDYTLVLPIKPTGATGVMTLDTSGNMGTSTYAALGGQVLLANAVGLAMNSSASANNIGATMTTASGLVTANALTTATALVTVAKNIKSSSKNVVVSNTNATNSLAIIRGQVLANGTLANGEGFTSVRNSAGNYTLTWTTAFADIPAVTACTNGGGSGALDINQILTTAAQIIIPADSIFTFIAIGQRA